MRVRVHASDLNLSAVERSEIEVRLAATLRHFRSRIVQLLLSIRDMNGPKGGRDKVGRATVYLRSGKTVVVQANASSLGELIANLAASIRGAVQSRVTRSRKRNIRTFRRVRRVSHEMRPLAQYSA